MNHDTLHCSAAMNLFLRLRTALGLGAVCDLARIAIARERTNEPRDRGLFVGVESRCRRQIHELDSRVRGSTPQLGSFRQCAIMGGANRNGLPCATESAASAAPRSWPTRHPRHRSRRVGCRWRRHIGSNPLQHQRDSLPYADAHRA